MLSCVDADTLTYLKGVIARLLEAEKGQKGPIKNEAMARLGWGATKLSGQLKVLGYPPERKARSDKGIRMISEEEAKKVSNILMAARRDNGKKLMSTKTAIRLAFEQGWLRAEYSVDAMNKRMRECKVHPDQLNQPAPSVRLRSLHPNHVWQFDVSFCVLYYLKDASGLHVMPKEEFYSNKPENFEKIKNNRVLRYLMIDHCTGAFYVEYFLAPGEKAEVLFEFLMHSFHKRHENDPMHGLPAILYMDKGGANTSHLIKHLLKQLEIRTEEHEAGNPRAKGQVEGAHNVIECEFEGRLAFKQINSLHDLNEQAYQWCRAYNATERHTRHGQTRYGLWQTIREDQLRIAPSEEIFQQIAQKQEPEPRQIRSDLSISFVAFDNKSRQYDLSRIAGEAGLIVGDTVEVYANPFNRPNINVSVTDIEGNERRFECEPIELDQYGFDVNAREIGKDYRSAPQTIADKHRAESNEAVYGVKTKKEVKKRRKARKTALGDTGFDSMADVKAQTIPDYMKRRGKQFHVETQDVTSPLISPTKATKEVHRQSPFSSPEERADYKTMLRERYGNSVTMEQAKKLRDEQRAKHAQTQATPR